MSNEVSPPRRVLLVEDEAPLRRALARVLTKHGYEVIEAEDGAHATQLSGAHSFDAVLTDLVMPRVDGLGLLRYLRARRIEVAIVMMTGTPDEATAAEAYRLGALGYLTKPLETSRLLETMERALSAHASTARPMTRGRSA